jgi:hypothetical protein
MSIPSLLKVSPGERPDLGHADTSETPGFDDLAAAEILAEALRDMDPQWPEAEEELSGIVIPD